MSNEDILNNDNKELIKTVWRYLSFWPFFMVSIIISLTISYLFLRYEPLVYKSNAKIEVLDTAMDRDMALPTAMTIFNRSTINLENEIEVIKSNRLIKSVVENLDLNIKFYTVGRLKTTEYHPSEWLYNIRHKFERNFSNENWFTINEYLIEVTENGLNITILINGDESEKIIIEGYDTSVEFSRLPFILS